jgi:hypothetical protein
MSSSIALLPAARSMSARSAQAALRNPAQMTHRLATLPDTRRTEISLEETMIHDLYLMSATPWLEAATTQNFSHRTLTYSEMAASGKRRDKGANATKKTATNRAKGLFLAMLEGVLRT